MSKWKSVFKFGKVRGRDRRAPDPDLEPEAAGNGNGAVDNASMVRNVIGELQKRLTVSTILPHVCQHMPYLKDKVHLIQSSLNQGNSNAVVVLIESVLSVSETEPGWFQAFINILNDAGYGDVADCLIGNPCHPVDDGMRDDMVYAVRQHAFQLSDVIPSQIIPDMGDHLDDTVLEEIQQVERRHGNSMAMQILLNHLCRSRTECLFRFLHCLEENGHSYVASLIQQCLKSQSKEFAQVDDAANEDEYKARIRVTAPLLERLIIKPWIIVRHLSFLQPDFAEKLHALDRSGNDEVSVKRFISELLKAEDSYTGWFNQLTSALREEGYEYLADMLEGKPVPDMDQYGQLLSIFAVRLNDINPDEILTHMGTHLTETDREEIHSHQNNYGAKYAAVTLIDRVWRRGYRCFCRFVNALRDIGREDLAVDIDPKLFCSHRDIDDSHTEVMDEKKSLSVQSFCSSDENNESPCAENNTDTSTAHASIYTDELPIPLYIGPINANVVQHSLLEVRGAACRELPTQTFRLQSFVQRDYTRPYANENNFNVDISHMYASNEAHVSSEVKHLNITDDGKNGMGILKTCLVYEYSKVMKATNEFDVMNIMHKGQFGAIFHGTMFGQIFGMLRITSEEVNSEGEVVILYENEISALMMFRHPSIIMLQGSAFSGNDAVLIYEYLSVGTFADWLHSSVQDPLVRCYESLAVLTGVASALSYLHNVLQFPFIHGSVNSYHILLGDNLKPKLFGFWCSHYCLGSRCINVVDMNMIEKYQYKAFMPGGLVPSFIHSPRIDIYGLRAIMYDVLCGRTDTISEAPGSEETIFEDFVSQPYENLKRQMKLNTSKWPEDIVRGLYGLIWKCLQQCIGDKQENIQEIHECLERLTRRRSDTSEMAGMFNVAAQTAFHVL